MTNETTKSTVTTIQEREQHLRARSAARGLVAELGGHFCGFVGVRPGQRSVIGAQVYVIDEPAMELLDPRYDVANHSPDGFEWGYGGSGPAQLALAICCNMVGRDRAERVYQDFKWIFVARSLQQSARSWLLRREDALQIIEQIESDLDAGKNPIEPPAKAVQS